MYIYVRIKAFNLLAFKLLQNQKSSGGRDHQRHLIQLCEHSKTNRKLKHISEGIIPVPLEH